MKAIISVKYNKVFRNTQFHRESIIAKASEIEDKVNEYIYKYVNNVDYHHVPAEQFAVSLYNGEQVVKHWVYKPTNR